MKSVYYITIFTILTGLPCSQLYADEHSLPTFSAQYKLYASGMEIGEMDRAFSQSGTNSNDYIYRSETRTTGLAAIFHKDIIVEQSRLKFIQQKIRPMQYTYQRTGGKKERNINVKFDWNNQKITNVVNETTMQFELEQDTLDKLIYQYVIMRDIQNNKLPYTYPIVDGRKIKTYNFRLLNEETIETPIGTFQTVKIERVRQNSEDKTYLWCAPDLQYLPIKVENIEKDSWTTVAIINSLTGLGY